MPTPRDSRLSVLHRRALRVGAPIRTAAVLSAGLFACAAPQVGRSPEALASFSFGAIADCQYCSVVGEGVRKYSMSDAKLARCVEHLNQLELEHVVHLGDFIDRDFQSFAAVGPIFERLEAPGYHVLGNHDYSVADERKQDVVAALGMPSRFHAFTSGGWRFIVLDGNDISIQSSSEGSPERRAAEAMLEATAGSRPWNGALGAEQLDWLAGALAAAEAAGEDVVLYCHFPVLPLDPGHNLWNAAEVVELIEAFPNVRAYINGHNHAGAYELHNGVHYVTLKGMVDTDETSYAVVTVHRDRLELEGFGREGDRVLLIER